MAAGGFRLTGLHLGTAADPSVQFTGDVNTGAFSSGADTFDITTAGTSWFRVGSTGHVTLLGTTGALRTHNLTTAQRDLLTAAAGMLLYNTTTTTLNGYINGAWTALATFPASLTADVSGILPTANGGTGIAFFTAAGPSVARVYTFPDAAATVLTTNAAVTVAQGGTGVATLGDAGVLIGNATGAVQVTGAGTSGQVLTSNGAGVDPTFQAAAGGTAPSSAVVATSETTTSDTFTDLATAGPAVTVTITATGSALVIVTARGANSDSRQSVGMAAAVSGATTRAADLVVGLMFTSQSAAGGDATQASAVHLFTGLTAGSNTFTAKYRRVGGTTATFSERNIIVYPY